MPKSPEQPKSIEPLMQPLTYEKIWEEWLTLEPQLPEGADPTSNYDPEARIRFIVVDASGHPLLLPQHKGVSDEDSATIENQPFLVVTLHARRTTEIDEDWNAHYTKNNEYFATLQEGTLTTMEPLGELRYSEKQFEEMKDPFNTGKSLFLPIVEVFRHARAHVRPPVSPKPPQEEASSTPSVYPGRNILNEPTAYERRQKEGTDTSIHYLSLIRQMITRKFEPNTPYESHLRTMDTQYQKTAIQEIQRINLAITEALLDPEVTFSKPVKLSSDLVLKIYDGPLRGENLAGAVQDFGNLVGTLVITLYQSTQSLIESETVTEWKGGSLLRGCAIAELVQSLAKNPERAQLIPLIQALKKRNVTQIRFEVVSHRTRAGEPYETTVPLFGAIVSSPEA